MVRQLLPWECLLMLPCSPHSPLPTAPWGRWGSRLAQHREIPPQAWLPVGPLLTVDFSQPLSTFRLTSFQETSLSSWSCFPLPPIKMPVATL